MLALLSQSNFFFFDLFQFIFHISITYLICIFLILINLILFINNQVILKKITYFFFTLLTCLTLVWHYSLETFGFILLLVELSLIFFFCIVATQYTFKNLAKPINFWKFALGTVCFLSYIELNLQPELIANQSIYYYSASFFIITADYFFIYYFLILYLDIIINIALILGLFSIYFILIYYYLKNINTTHNKNKKSIYFLRKQNLLHQSLYQTYLRWFQ